MSDTTTTTAAAPTTEASGTISPEIKQRVIQVKLNATKKKVADAQASWNDAQNRLAGAYLLNIVGINGEEAPLLEAIEKAVARRESLGVTLELIEGAAKTVAATAVAGKWEDFQKGLDSANATATTEVTPAVEAEPKPRRKRSTAPARRINRIERFSFPEIQKAPELPEISASMSAFAKVLGPRWEAASAKVKGEVLAIIQPAMEHLVEQVNSALITIEPPPEGVDETAVREIVDKRLNNGVGEEVRKVVSAAAPRAMVDVLEKAALAVSSTIPDDSAEETLRATFTPIPDPFYAWTPELTAIANLIEQASRIKPQNALLVGPTGCGKTELAIQFAAKFGRPVMIMDCANIREARDWFGQKGAASGRTFFKKSQFWMALEKGGVVIVLDEFNRSADHVRNTLMPVLDHRRQTFVEEVGETLKVGPGTIFFATLNEGLDYSGTHTTDRAMKNRFPRRIEINYLPEDKEIEVLCNKVERLTKGDANKMVGVADVIRKKAAQFGGGLSETISTRQLIAAAEDYVIAGPVSFQASILAHFSAEDGTNSERAQVLAAIEGKGFKMDNAAAAALAATSGAKKK